MLWDPVFERVADVTGAQADQVKLIAALVVSYPLASIYVRLPASRPNLAHIFSLVVTTIFLGPLLGLWRGYLELIFASVGTYLIVAGVRGKNMPWIAFFFVMAHLTITHIRREWAFVPVENIEISGSHMVLVMKLTTFAWNVHDGRQKAETLDDSQMATRLTQLPNPLAFLGYCFFFPSVLVGPSFDYASYHALVTHTLYGTPPPGSNAAASRAVRRRTPHGRRRVAYLHLAMGLIFILAFASLGSRGDYHRILTPVWYTWAVKTRFGFIQFCGLVARIKYYGAWSLSEGACILTGIGFNGYDPKTGRTRWNRVRNINIMSIEFAESYKQLLDSWNCRTNVWLRDCVYKRLTTKGKKPGAAQSMATFVTSAFWHGLAPGYYLTFVTGGLLSYLGRQLRRYVRPYFLPEGTVGAANSLPRWPFPNLSKRFYDVVGWAVVQVTLNYAASAFLLLKFWSCIHAWSRMGWYGHIAILVAFLFFHFGGRKWLRKGIPAREVPKKVAVAPPSAAPLPEFKVSPPTPRIEEPEDRYDNADGEDTDLEWVRHDLGSPTEEGLSSVVEDRLEELETRPGTPSLKKDL